MRLVTSCIIALILFQGCNSRKDLIGAAISREKLQEDFTLFKNLVTKVHSGAYAYNTPSQLDRLFDSVAKTIDGPLTTREFYNKVDLVLDRLHCIHSKTAFPDEYYDSLSNQPMFFPIPLVVIGNRLYVNSTAYTVALGSEVIAVNDKPATDLINELSVYAHTDGYSNNARHSAIDDDFAINYYLAYGAFKQFSIRCAAPGSGKFESVNVTAEKLKDINDNMYNDTYYFYPGDAPYDFEMMDEKDAAVLTLRSFGFDTYATSTAFSHFIDNSFRLIYQNEIHNLVIDCRNNGGGFYSCTYPVLSYLVNETLPEYDSATRRFDRLPYTEYLAAEDTSKLKYEDSTRKNYTRIRDAVFTENKAAIKEWEPDLHVFKGRLFLIINEHVASAASNFAAILKEKTNALIIGEETGGNNAVHNAAVYNYELPNSHLKIGIPTKRFYQPVMQQQDGRGVLPHKYMPTSIDDVINYSDHPMTYVLDSLLTGKVK